MNTKIINLGIVAHVDAGKTTLTEQLLYRSGEVRKKGNVDEGTAQTDYLSIERERGISVKSSSVRILRGDKQINIIDTPGHVDFIGEVERSLTILDCAILVISAVEGIQAQTELLLEALRQTKTPTILFINKIDRVGSDVEHILQELKTQYQANVIQFQEPINQGTRECEVKTKDYLDQQFLEDIVLSISESEQDLLEKYLSGQAFTHNELVEAIKNAIQNAQLMPVLCASASLGVGIEELLNFITDYTEGHQGSNTEELSAIVYKIEHDKTMGKIAHVRMFGGSIKNRDSIYIPSLDKSQKVTQIRRVFGEKYTDIGEVGAGDVAALCGLSSIQIGDVIGTRGTWNDYKLAVPLLKVQVLPENEGELAGLLSALRELCDEDPLLDMEYISEEKEIQIKITGTIQLEIISALLKERYNLTVSFSPPSVIYKETPTKIGEGFEAYTMPKPCWAIVKLLIEPGKPGSGIEYSSTVSNNDIFLRYQNHVKTSVFETLKQGLYGWEVTDLKVTLIYGEHHIMHTHPMDFFLATPMAVMNGLVNTGTTLLEPMITMKINAQEEFLGKIIGDLVQMRGEFEAPVIRGSSFQVEAHLPVATSLEYPIKLAMLTSGRAVISSRFAGFSPCPLELGATTKRRGVDPLDRAKWILSKRNAL
ncbi:MAG: TetM/TetW/TetO/TetS family tetracycline resistance ribosomal protection protein [Herbinix sp.]|jgi:ribosomal protection tetracycline resistance protein|nr:TetM/TetW/TetO/TetS family tetracycline resistance ribosomal protection protein [Herbinix sp.]